VSWVGTSVRCPFVTELRLQSSFKLSRVLILLTFGSRMFKGISIAAVAGCVVLASSCNHAAEKRPLTQPPTRATAPVLQAPAKALRATDSPKSHDDVKSSSQKTAKAPVQPVQKEKQKATAKSQTVTKAPMQQAKSQPEKSQPVSKTTPQQSATPPPATQKTDPVAVLISQVEKQYEQGQAEYQAGHLESAKSSFDKAVDMLLQSPIDLRSDDRLQNEFDKIIEGVNQLEMVALKEGDGFTEQQTVPAPITEANEVTFPVDPNVKAKAEEQVKETRSDLPLVVNDYVASYINYFNTSGRSVLEKALVRAGRYREMIAQTFKDEGVPLDLMFLAQAESGFQPLALNPSGARGMWQFMSSRAAGYGLRRSWWIDERQDPVKSTRAAARHLKDLYKQFGDWYLAMAAYDSGPGNVQQAVRRTGYADFWELYKRNVLPKETKNYVPIILAYAIMSKNPAQYRLDKLQPEQPLETDNVKANYPVDLRLVAECIDVPVEKLIELNPSLLRLTTPKDASFDLRLPAGTRDKYLTAVAAIPPDKRVFWRYHKVEQGETLDAIARKYRTNDQAIAQANNLDSDELKPDTKLIIPINSLRSAPVTAKQTYSRKPTRYVAHRGDTVISVADDFGVPPEKVRHWNHLTGNEIRKGKALVIYRPVSNSESAAINRPNVSHSERRRGRKSSYKPSNAKSRPGSTRTGSAAEKSSEGKNGTTAELR
jgi:membrane-bound lytic murein transglycosylase D